MKCSQQQQQQRTCSAITAAFEPVVYGFTLFSPRQLRYPGAFTRDCFRIIPVSRNFDTVKNSGYLIFHLQTKYELKAGT
jgi:hypothetical protein